MSPVIDPGIVLYSQECRAQVLSLNGFFWIGLARYYRHTGINNLDFVKRRGVKSKFSWGMISKYLRLIDTVNSRQKAFLFDICAEPRPVGEVHTAGDIDRIVDGVTSAFRPVILEMIENSGMLRHNHFVFSVRSVFEIALLKLVSTELRLRNPNIRIDINELYHENFRIGNISDFIEENGYHLAERGTVSSGVPTSDLDIDGPRFATYGTPVGNTVVSVRLFDKPCYWGKCAFCSQSGKIFTHGKSYNVDSAISILEFYHENGIRAFIFNDECIPIDVLLKLSECMLTRGIRASWCCRMRFDTVVTQEQFSILARAGCVEILFGIETNSNRVLELISKYDEPFDESTFLTACHHMNRAGILVHISLIIGFPFELEEDVRGLVRFISDMIDEGIRFTYFLNIYQYFKSSKMDALLAGLVRFREPVVDEFNGILAYSYEAGTFWYDMDICKFVARLRHSVDSRLFRDFFPTRRAKTLHDLFHKSAQGLFLAGNPGIFSRNRRSR